MPTLNIRFAYHDSLTFRRGDLFELEADQGIDYKSLKPVVKEHLMMSDALCPLKHFDKWYFETNVDGAKKLRCIDESLVVEDEIIIYLEGPMFPEDQAASAMAIAVLNEKHSVEITKLHQLISRLTQHVERLDQQVELQAQQLKDWKNENQTIKKASTAKAADPVETRVVANREAAKMVVEVPRREASPKSPSALNRIERGDIIIKKESGETLVTLENVYMNEALEDLKAKIQQHTSLSNSEIVYNGQPITDGWRMLSYFDIHHGAVLYLIPRGPKSHGTAK